MKLEAFYTLLVIALVQRVLRGITLEPSIVRLGRFIATENHVNHRLTSCGECIGRWRGPAHCTRVWDTCCLLWTNRAVHKLVLSWWAGGGVRDRYRRACRGRGVPAQPRPAPDPPHALLKRKNKEPEAAARLLHIFLSGEAGRRTNAPPTAWPDPFLLLVAWHKTSYRPATRGKRLGILYTLST